MITLPSLRSLAFISISCLVSTAAIANDTTAAIANDTTAGVDSPENERLAMNDFVSSKVTGRYDETKVNQFLDQFAGEWEGSYSISTLEGDVLKAVDANLTYSWDVVDGTRVLRCQSVYTDGSTMSHSESKSYFWRGRLVSEVIENDVKRVYFGVISGDGKTVNWDPANTTDYTKETTEETFAEKDGQRTLTISGYENFTQGNFIRMLKLHGSLVRKTAG